MYGLEKLLEIEAAQKKARRRRAQTLWMRRYRKRLRDKKKKEAEKEERKKLRHKKYLKKKQNQRAYQKRRQKVLEERKARGDEFGYYNIVVTKNNKKVVSVGYTNWKVEAYKIYNEAIEKNRNTVLFPKIVGATLSHNDVKKAQPLKYEILLVKKASENEDTVSSFKNKNGKFVDNIVIDKKDRVIIEKDDWFVEEEFGIYGYHPYKEKKTYSFILNDMLLSKDDTGDEMRRIMVYRNKLIIQYLTDFDFVQCFDEQQCKMLYDKLLMDIEKMKKKYIVFMGEVVPDLIAKWIDRFEEKTGWTRASIKRTTTF